MHITPIDNKQFEFAWLILRGRGSFQARISPSDYKMSARVQGAVCKYYEIRPAELISVRRNRMLVNARHVAIYLCHDHTSLSLSSIANEFGGMDHTTILYAIRRIKRLQGTSVAIATALRDLNKELGASHD